jgi:hypothetical protein
MASDSCDCDTVKAKKQKPYGRRKTQTIKWIYIVASVLWVLLVVFFCLWRPEPISLLILAIPLIIFAFGYANAQYLTVESEDGMYTGKCLAIAILIILPLLAWVDKGFTGDKKLFIRIMILSMTLAILSLMDVWLRPKWISIAKHIKSALQTGALVLLIYALYIYYIDRQGQLR